MTDLTFELHDKQAVAFESPATEILYGGSAGGGKALALDTPIATPAGWATMGSLRAGDQVLSDAGKPCNVLACTEIMLNRLCYRVEFCDGSHIIADAEHEWLTYSVAERAQLAHRTDEFRERRRASRPKRGTGAKPWLAELNAKRVQTVKPESVGSLRTTAQIAESIMCGKNHNHAIRVQPGLILPDAELPIDPYVLGVWLGDGTRGQGAITSADSEIVQEITKRGYATRKRTAKYAYGVLGLQKQLRQLGITNTKRIPAAYLRASHAQRLDLVRGLMDTDGTIGKDGGCQFDNCDRDLIGAMHELLISIGIKCTITEGRAKIYGKDCGPKYRISFTTLTPVFLLDRKLDRIPKAVRGSQNWRVITACERVESVPVRCIMVDSPSSMYLAGRHMVPTHNSHLIRVAAIVWALQIPGLQIYIFRRHHGDLHKNHMAGETSFPVLLAPLVAVKQCRIVEGEIRFANSSTIHLCHCQHESDKYKYQGPEIHVLIVDEATHFSESIYRFLRSRVRMGTNSLVIPDALKGLFPRIILCTNPGGIGHNWVKRGWVSPHPPLTVWRTGKPDGGFIRQYIPARVRDNPSLDAETYEANLMGLGDESLVKAMLDGNWDIVAGGALDDVWSDKVVIPRFRVPVGWTVDRCFDWGDSSPFAVLWVAEADGTESKHLVNGKPFCPPRGSLIVLQEWYGATDGTEGARVGLKMPISEIAQGIIRHEKLLRNHWLMRVHPGPADNAINVAVSGMPSIGEVMASEGVYWTESDKSPGSRINGLALMRELLAETKKPRPERPCLYIMDNCRNLIENLPVLPRDPKKPDDVATGSEDHDYDALRYRVLAMKRGTVENLRI